MRWARVKEQSVGQDTIIVKHIGYERNAVVLNATTTSGDEWRRVTSGDERRRVRNLRQTLGGCRPRPPCPAPGAPPLSLRGAPPPPPPPRPRPAPSRPPASASHPRSPSFLAGPAIEPPGQRLARSAQAGAALRRDAALRGSPRKSRARRRPRACAIVNLARCETIERLLSSDCWGS